MGAEVSMYDKEISLLFQRFPSVQNVGFGGAYKPGLERMRQFASLLGNPQEKYATIHVAGTNGKGSVANMTASALAGAGLKCGLYTSPHILDFRERMRVATPGDDTTGNCSDIVGKEWVYDFILRYKPAFEELRLSFFEITTGMAFLWFAEQKVDVAVIETGLGGRLDSTNIIVPELSMITSIGLDHCSLLGNTLEAIAGEKAGIIKPGVPVVVGQNLPETAPVFEKTADGCGSKIVFADRIEPPMWKEHPEILRKMDLQGKYQDKNLRTVLAALDVFKDSKGICQEALCKTPSERLLTCIEHTASRMDFHGRWERLCSNPLTICDIGHNAAALKENFAQLEICLKDGKISSLSIVYGVMADKDLDAIIPLMPLDADWYFATASTPRALDAEKIFNQVCAWRQERGISTERLHWCPSVEEAVASARKMCSISENPMLYIGGSTFVVADAVQMINK